MKYCKYCGAELPDDVYVCTRCGKSILEPTTQTVVIQQTPSAQANQSANYRTGKEFV